jgi:hypothetical protein
LLRSGTSRHNLLLVSNHGNHICVCCGGFHHPQLRSKQLQVTNNISKKRPLPLTVDNLISIGSVPEHCDSMTDDVTIHVNFTGGLDGRGRIILASQLISYSASGLSGVDRQSAWLHHGGYLVIFAHEDIGVSTT